MSRVVRALEQSAAVQGEAVRTRRASRQLRAARHNTGVPPGGEPVEQYTVWSSPDGRIVCAVIPYSSSLHELALIRDGQVVSAKAFVDPVEATDEAERLRHLFLKTSDDDPERRA